MTFAWYGHLKYRSSPLILAIVVSWGIAFFEYCFQVPANRIGSYQFSVVQLKTIQEIITLVVFCFFSSGACHLYKLSRGNTNQVIVVGFARGEFYVDRSPPPHPDVGIAAERNFLA